MLKWVAGIVAVCLVCVLADEIVDASRPVKLDEEMILDAILAPKHLTILDVLRDAQNPVVLFDEWKSNEHPESFESCVKSQSEEMKRNLDSSNWDQPGERASNSESSRNQDEYFLKLQREYETLLAIQKNIGSVTKAAFSSKPVSLKGLNLDPRIEVIPAGNWKGEGMPITTRTGAVFEAGCANDLSYPVFSKDRRYAYVLGYIYYYHFSVRYYFLEKSRTGWRLVATYGSDFV